MNGKLNTRYVESIPTALGTQNLDYDSLAQYYGDLYGVPPQYFKRQALQESAGYTKNFRFEQTTINVGCLSGDLGANTGVCDGNAYIPREPWSHYIVAGTSLGTYRPKSNDKADAKETQYFSFQNPNQVAFGLGVPVKRTVGGVLNATATARLEASYEVYAHVENVNGTQPQAPLDQVHLETVWQRGSGSSVGVDTQAGVCSSGVSVELTKLNLGVRQLAVCYGSGQVFLGAPLAAGQRLVVSYWPVQKGWNDNVGNPTVIDTPGNPADGDLVAGAPVLKAPVVRAINQLLYSKGQTLANFLQSNIVHGRGFLTGTDSDESVEFMFDQNNQLQPRDPRYQFMTSQPYASSSYGLFQLPFTPGARVKLNLVFNPGYASLNNCPIQNCAPTVTPLYQLLNQPQMNFDLAGRFHQLSLKTIEGDPLGAARRGRTIPSREG